MVRTAFVLCAGKGTRLRPLTNRVPKPLVPICGVSLVEFALSRLVAAGIERIVINTHHLPEAFLGLFSNYPNESSYAGVPVYFRHEPLLLDTAGGLKNVEDLLLPGPVLVYNGDIFADIDMAALVEAHMANPALSTLALRSSGNEMRVSFDEETGRITDFRGELGTKDPRFLYAGICVADPKLLLRIPENLSLSLVHVWIEALRGGEEIRGVVLNEGEWRDIGTIEEYDRLHEDLRQGKITVQPPATAGEEWHHLGGR